MKAIILARVSTEEQREAGNSLPAQVKRLEDYCARKAFKIIKKYSFDESAYKNKRDEFDKILSLNLPNSKVVPLFLDFSFPPPLSYNGLLI
jgi:DNA invertase Pin-like site-specific DNA recombinase